MCTPYCNIQKCCNKYLTIFKLDPTPSNIFQHDATGWPNMCNMLCATMLQNVALKCCMRLAGPLNYIFVRVLRGNKGFYFPIVY